MDSIPTTMRAAVLTDYKGSSNLNIERIPVPKPGPGQVLVRMAYAAVNPSDLGFIRGLYGFKKNLPAVAGFEGSGTIVAAGSGLIPTLLCGRRVACAAASPNIQGGTWAEYLVTDAKSCVPIQKHISLQEAACMLVNPFTAWALMQIARQNGHQAILQSAAASALGQMIIKLGQHLSIETINIVRRDEQIEMLRKLGAKHVLNSNDENFTVKLREICHDLPVSLGFDAVAGDLSSQMLHAMPDNSRLLVYGALSERPCRVNYDSLIFKGQSVQGFWLSRWFEKMNIFTLLLHANKVQRLLATDLQTVIHKQIVLEDILSEIVLYSKQMTSGKLLVQIREETAPQ